MDNSNDIFLEDLFNRELQVKSLYSLIETAEVQFVTCIDAPFGYGKTTFFEMFKKYADQNFKEENSIVTIQYNAWENDFFENPLLSLISSITVESKNELTSSELKRVLADIGSNLVSILTRGTINPKELMMCEDEKPGEKLLSEYQNTIDERNSLKKALADMRVNNNNNKIVFLIDELDRCRPSFSIKMLETIKHFFDIDGIYFVLAMDKEQLKSTVSKFYGSTIDSNGYLRRFIDFDVALSKPTNKVYFEEHLREFNINGAEFPFVVLIEILSEVTTNLDFSLRDCDKLIKYFKLVFNTDYLKVHSFDDRSTLTHEYIRNVTIVHLLSSLLPLKVKDHKLFKDYINHSLSAENQNIINDISCHNSLANLFTKHDLTYDNGFKGIVSKVYTMKNPEKFNTVKFNQASNPNLLRKILKIDSMSDLDVLNRLNLLTLLKE
ncbi:KAP family P-loop NTPase fold protein [Fusibacter sp. JL298sf-3]